MNKEQVLKEMFDESVKGRGENLIVIRSGPAIVVSLQGGTRDLISVLAKAFEQDSRIKDIVKKAMILAELKNDDSGFMEFLKKLLDFSPTDCDNCPVAENCSIKDKIAEGEACEGVEELIKEVFNRKKEEGENNE